MTTIEDTVTYADGSLANGRLVVYWKPFTVNSVQVGGGELQYEIVNGAVLVSLYSNQTAQPLGSYYNAKYELENGPVYVEQWIVPNYPTVNIGQCKVSFPPTPSVIISPLQLSSLGGQPGMFLEWDGSKWTPAYPSTFNMTPNWIGLVAGTTGTDINIVGSPAAVGNSMTINIPSASATARGVVTTGAQTFAGNKTFTGNLTVTGTVTLPANSYVPVGRMINTGAGLTGGGSLSADLTLAAVPLTASGSAHSAGYAPDPGPTTGNTRYLREDAVWVLPPFSAVQSVFGRIGAIVAQASDYAAYYVALATQVIAGAGMTGGGALTGDVTLNAAVTSVFGRTGAVVLTPADISAAGGVPATRQILTGTGLTGGGDLTADRTLSVVTDTTTQRLEAALGGTLVAARRQFNFIAGSGQTINVVDNPSFNRVDITLNTSGTGPASPSIYAVNGTAIGTRPELNLVAGTNTTLTGVDNSGANRVDITVTSVGSGAVASVFGRSGAVVAVAGDYTAAQVTNAVSILGSYADPAWITSLAYGKLTGVPSVSSMQTPWLSNINAASYNLDNLGHLGVGIASQASTGIYVYRPSAGVTYPVFVYSVSLNNYGVMHQESDATGLAGFAAINDSSKYGGFAIYGSNYASSTYRNNTAFLASGDLMIETGTTYVERMRITAAGRVGIGTASPGYMLDVNGDCNLSVGSVYRIGGVPLSTGGGYWVAGSGGAIYYNGGSVGIGTASPGAPLEIDGVAVPLMLVKSTSTTATPAIEIRDAGATPHRWWLASGLSTATDGTFAIYDVANGARLAITQAGNVGIGTTSPAIRFQISDGTNHSLMFIPGTTNTIQSMNDTGGAWVPMQILAVNNLYLNPTGGNVGIGTTSPGCKFETFGAGGPPATSGTTDAAPAARFSIASGGNILEIGGYSASPFGMWITTSDRNNQASVGGYPLCLQPSGGSVGIGTTSPLSLFHVHTGADQNFLVAPYTSWGAVNGVCIASLNDVNSAYRNISISAANILLNCVGGTGYVGIGTSNPLSMLSVITATPSTVATATQFAIGEGSNNSLYRLTLGYFNDGVGYKSAIQSTQGGPAAGILLLQPSGGTVGIGTANPRGVLDVTAGIGSSASYMYFTGNASGVLPATGQVALTWNASGGGAEVALFNCSVGASSSFRFYQLTSASAATTLMTIQANGNVGIGMTNPSTTLHVNGAVCIGSGAATSGSAGDLNLSRNVAPAQGAIFFGNSGAYIYWDGAKWNFAPVGPGGGITVQNVVTGSRNLTSNFQNTTGKPMWVAAAVTIAPANSAYGYTDAAASPTTAVSSYGNAATTNVGCTISFWVLPGNYYRIVSANGGALNFWTEWY